MKKSITKTLCTVTLLGAIQMGLLLQASAQQSVRRPSELEKEFTEFRLTLEEMNKLETTMDKRLRVVEDDLSAVEKEITGLPKGSKKRAVAAEKWEGLVSEALKVRIEGLVRLRSFRDKAITLLERVVKKDPSNQHLVAKIEKQIEDIKSGLTKTEAEIEKLAVILAYASGPDDDKRELIRELEFTEDAKLPVQKRQAQWLADWKRQFESSPAAITGQKGKLRLMLAALKNRFIEFDLEIERIKLIADARKHFVEARIEWRKLVEVLNTFNDYAQNINAAAPSTNSIMEKINTRLMTDISGDQLPPQVELRNIESSLETAPSVDRPTDYRQRVDRILNKVKK
jgi:hypothetical protein